MNTEKEKIFWLTIARIEKILKNMHTEDDQEILMKKLDERF